jgi:hypothetical protein
MTRSPVPLSRRLLNRLAIGSLCTLGGLSACGGGGGDAGGSSGSGGTGGGFTIGDAASQAAAAQTATKAAACTAIAPFYWEVGDAAHPVSSGSTGDGSVARGTSMLIASASKWVFGAYVAQKRAGALTADDLQHLQMGAGYHGLSYDLCLRLSASAQAAETIDQCFHSGADSAFTGGDVGHFFYNGGHFQHLADSTLALGGMDSAQLTADFVSTLGIDASFAFDSPQMAAGLRTTPGDYATFLDRLMDGQLRMSTLLGASPVCTNPSTCASAISTPVPLTESWHYSVAHWVEDDPVVGDGAFSSPGAFGFYPWIDATRHWYGVIARQVQGDTFAYYASVQCGRAIRKAWMTGQAQG